MRDNDDGILYLLTSCFMDIYYYMHYTVVLCTACTGCFLGRTVVLVSNLVSIVSSKG
jgi:hypothetical protein